eukprot:5635028-Pleurochrysis_carterae.AAC.2
MPGSLWAFSVVSPGARLAMRRSASAPATPEPPMPKFSTSWQLRRNTAAHADSALAHEGHTRNASVL